VTQANPKSTPTAEQLDREREALGLRQAGYTYDRIAQSTGYANADGAWKAVRRAISRSLQEPVAELVSLESARLDRLQTAVWAAAIKGDLGAVDRVLSIMARRAKLCGLDQAPDAGQEIEAMKLMLYARQLEIFETAMLAMLADLRIDTAAPATRLIIGQRLSEAAKTAAQPLEIGAR